MKEPETVIDTATVEKTTEIKKQGKTWKNSRLFQTYEGADQERQKLLESGEFEVKVKRRPRAKFVVKSRRVKNEQKQRNN